MNSLVVNVVVTILSVSILIGGLFYMFYSMEKKSKEKQEKKAGRA